MKSGFSICCALLLACWALNTQAADLGPAPQSDISGPSAWPSQYNLAAYAETTANPTASPDASSAAAQDDNPADTATDSTTQTSSGTAADSSAQIPSDTTNSALLPSAAPTQYTVPTVLPQNDLWGRIRNGFALPELDTPLVRENEEWYASRPDYVRRMVERSRRYLYHIVEETEKRGMPSEIALLPMIESAFNPKAYSPSHAAGIWQFIPSTGKHFGLQQNWWHDDRYDVIASTDAALDYLQKLHDMFGDWELALAAYNWGEGAVSRAIARNQARGEPTDFLSLNLPPETRSYVPRLLAVKHIVENPAAFDLDLASIPNRPYFTTVAAPKNIDVKLAARLANVPLDEFVSLNPSHNRPVIRGGESRTMLLPVDKADTFAANLEDYSKPLASWQTYTPRRGEKLLKIARKFGISLTTLKETNSLGHRSRAATGQALLVPAHGKFMDNLSLASANPTPQEDEPTRHSAHSRVYTVKKGDTLFSIAKRFDVSAADLKSWNHIKSGHLKLKQKLSIHGETAVASRTPAKGRNKIVVAQRAKDKKHAKIAAASKPRRYTVRRGDTLHSIARKFKVAVNDIQRWNKLSTRHTLQPGAHVALYNN
ncbi:MAG: lytic transglycosylase [Burkholderiales bacterium]